MSSSPFSQHKLALVLLHYPVTNKLGETVTTSITNLDIHDLARSARTYEIDHYYLVNPIPEQHEIVNRLLAHWKNERSKEKHPKRVEALIRAQLCSYFKDVKEDLITRYPGLPLEVVMPDARPLEKQISYDALRSRWQTEHEASIKVIVLGTGWGIAPEFFSEVNTFLAPIYGPLGREGYNHLSVRAAGAVILDRLLGWSPPKLDT